MFWGYNITSSQKMKNLNLNMRKYQTNWNQGTLHIIIAQYSSTFQKYQGHERQRLGNHSRLKKTRHKTTKCNVWSILLCLHFVTFLLGRFYILKLRNSLKNFKVHVFVFVSVEDGLTSPCSETSLNKNKNQTTTSQGAQGKQTAFFWKVKCFPKVSYFSKGITVYLNVE